MIQTYRPIVFSLVMVLYFATAMRAQESQSFQLSFEPIYNALPLQLDTNLADTNDTIQIETLKFYISNIELMQGDQVVFQEENSYHLVDASEKASGNIHLTIPAKIPFSTVSFTLGIDSTTNDAGAMGGDLDPTKGMYWTWQTGYINFKLEGTSPRCPARNNRFQFHLGGYAAPSPTAQKIIVPTTSQTGIVVQVDIAAFLAPMDLSKKYRVMIPGMEAMELSKKLSQLFTVAKQ